MCSIRKSGDIPWGDDNMKAIVYEEFGPPDVFNLNSPNLCVIGRGPPQASLPILLLSSVSHSSTPRHQNHKSSLWIIEESHL